MGTAECSDRTLFLCLFGFYVAWMMGIAVLAYNKLKGSTDYATHFVGRKDYGIVVMGLTIFASTVSGNSVSNNPNTAAALGYACFFIINIYAVINSSMSLMFPRMRRLSVERKWNSFSDILSDRYNSRPLCMFVLVFPCCSLQGYVIAQLWAFRDLLPVVSAGYITQNPITILITIVIYVCESFGGFDAVSYTDVVQGIIIIFALLIGPIFMATEFGVLDGTCEYWCANTYTETIPSGNTTKERLRGCYAYVSPWNVVHPSSTEYSYYFKKLWPDYGGPTYGIDGSIWFNNLAFLHMAYFVLQFGFPIFPHVVQRVFASKSDVTCKNSMLMMATCMILAGMPGILLGFYYAINLKPEYPPATPAFGAILDFMMRKGGFAEFCGVMAACGALAAIMSTIDSATLAITNIVTKEVVVNGLSNVFPQLLEPRTMTIIERGSSGMVLGIGMFFVCYHIPKTVESDPLEATMTMARIGFYQFGFIQQAFPCVVSALFFPSMRVFPLLVGIICSMTVLPILSVTLWEKKGYATAIPEIRESTPNLYIHPCVICTYLNWIIALILNKVLPEKLALLTSDSRVLMSTEEMMQIMEGTVEVFKSTQGRVASGILYTIMSLCVCWFGKQYDGCDFFTYQEYNVWWKDKNEPKPADCEPATPVGGFPPFGMTYFMCTCCMFLLNFAQFGAWKPREDGGPAMAQKEVES